MCLYYNLKGPSSLNKKQTASLCLLVQKVLSTPPLSHFPCQHQTLFGEGGALQLKIGHLFHFVPESIVRKALTTPPKLIYLPI